jgi:hypothetical protein
MLAAVLGGVLLWSGLARPSAPPGHKTTAASTSGAGPRGSATTRPRQQPRRRAVDQGRHGVADRTRGLVLPAAVPTRVSIPRLHVRSRLVRLGVDDSGAMEVPRDPTRAGWYDLGPAPGALGPAVIAGHVTWNRSPAVFYELATLRRGDLVRVDRADGRQAVFAVSRVARFEKEHFPTRAVFGALDHAGLRLITCGGTYDGAAHRYLDNVVVFTRLVRARSTR